MVDVLLLIIQPDFSVKSKRAAIAKKQGIVFDTRDKIEVIRDIEKQGIYLTPSFYPRIYLHDLIKNNLKDIIKFRIFPINGLSNSKTILCNENGNFVFFNSDEHGFNNPKGLFNKNKVDIALIGDSFTQGFCVEPGEDIGSRMRVNGKHVLNLGLGNNGPLIELASLIEFAKPVKPKIVLWLYFEGNDIDDLKDETQSSILLKYLNEKDFSQNLIHRQPEINIIVSNFLAKKFIKNHQKKRSLSNHILGIVKLHHLRKLLRKRKYAPHSFPPPPSILKAILNKAKNVSNSWGGRFYFVYLPSWGRYAKDVDQNTYIHRDKVLSIIRELNIPIIDMHEIFSSQPDPLNFFPFKLRGHYTNEGYRLTAKAIIQGIAQ